MRQFDVFRNSSKTSSKHAPYFLVLQSNLTQTGTTVVVAPLVLANRISEASKLFPHLHVRASEFVLATNELSAIRITKPMEPVANLEMDRDRIVAALDLLFTGI